MGPDDVLITITLGGLVLSGSYIRAGFKDLRRQRDVERRRSDTRPNPKHQSGAPI